MHNFKSHLCFFESQWPRINQMQQRCRDVYRRANSIIFRKKLKARLFAHYHVCRAHQKWMMKNKFGPDVNWVSTYCNRMDYLKDITTGSGNRGAVLQYIYWFDDKKIVQV